ncbi:MAG: ClbS/DfsB family four-helix bundle protein [Chloroflexota bacterium]|nr:ClbS/DfsB family four-helix bundle protein [Chloroflexota bacterium]
MNGPQDTTELMRAMSDAHIEWLGLLAQAGPDRLDEPGADGDWTLKDITAHLCVYEWWTATQLEAFTRGERGTVAVPPGPASLPPGSDTPDMEARNALIYAHNRARPAVEVLAESDQAFGALMAAVATFPATALTDPHCAEWTAGETPLAVVAGNSYEHYGNHIPAVRAWLGPVEPTETEES